MTPETSPSPSEEGPPRRASAIVARAAALTVSITVVVAVAAHASCGGGTEIRAEDPQDAAASARDSAAREKGSENDDDPGYMGGAKAPAGNWARPRKPEAPQKDPGAQQQAAPPQAPEAR